MTTRRDFIGGAGALPARCSAAAACSMRRMPTRKPPARRREVVVNGRRVKTVDIHAHCVFPEVMAMLDLKFRPPNLVVGADRFAAMDAQGIDMEAISINPFWYHADRDKAEALIKLQNEKLAGLVAAASRPLRRLRDGRDAAPRPRGEAARTRRQEARAARHVGRRQRRGPRARRSEVSSDLGQGRGARLSDLHPSGRHQGAGVAAARATAGSKTPSAIRSKPRWRCRT